MGAILQTKGPHWLHTWHWPRVQALPLLELVHIHNHIRVDLHTWTYIYLHIAYTYMHDYSKSAALRPQLVQPNTATLLRPIMPTTVDGFTQHGDCTTMTLSSTMRLLYLCDMSVYDMVLVTNQSASSHHV